MKESEESAVTPNNSGSSRDAAYWAKPVSNLRVAELPEGALNLNVDGRRVVGPLQGFGQMWQKTYRIKLSGVAVDPKAVVKVWKENFSSFWPQGNRFYGSLTGIQPGEVAVLNLSGPGGVPLSTGILVIYADDESFSFMTPEGHMFAGMITFSAFEEDGLVYAQNQVLIRANDPIYEIGCRLGIVHQQEDKFWQHTLKAVAAHFGATNSQVEQKDQLVDSKLQWSQAGNIWQNAAIRTGIHAPFAFLRRVIKRFD